MTCKIELPLNGVLMRRNEGKMIELARQPLKNERRKNMARLDQRSSICETGAFF